MIYLKWPWAILFTLVALPVTYFAFRDSNKEHVLTACLLAYAGAKIGVAYLTTRRGGWRFPAGFFIVWYSISWTFYVGYIVQVTYTQNRLPNDQLAMLYTSMFVSAVGSILTYPWSDTGLGAGDPLRRHPSHEQPTADSSGRTRSASLRPRWRARP